MIDFILPILTSPYIQLFILGLLAGFFNSDLVLPEALTKALAIYLMLAIGLKGGLALKEGSSDLSGIVTLIVIGIAFSFLLPFLSYFILRQTVRLDRVNCAAISAHYGSISAVTFSFASSYLYTKHIEFNGVMVAVLAFMEFPAILSGLMLAKRSRRLENAQREKLLSAKIVREVFLNGSIVLLIGGIIIGITSSEHGMTKIKPYLIDPFYAILSLFLLELGLVASRKMKDLDGFPLSLVIFGILMPLIGASICLGVCYIAGFDLGTTIMLTVLVASASYIAVPAAMKIALPQANPAYYVTLSLCITFPFNLILGVPLYTYLAEMIIL